MEIKYSKVENKLLDRIEVNFSLEYEGKSPSREEIRKELANKLSADENLLILDKFKQNAGEKRGFGYAKIYKNRDALERIERKHIIERNFKKKERKTEEKTGG